MIAATSPSEVPRRNGELVFEAPWESRAFGMVAAYLETTGLELGALPRAPDRGDRARARRHAVLRVVGPRPRGDARAADGVDRVAMTRPKGAARREEILAVTCEVVRERGFAHTRMSDVAHRLGHLASARRVPLRIEGRPARRGVRLRVAQRDRVDLDAIADATDSPLDRLDALLVAGVGPSTRASWALWIDSWGEALRSPVLRKTWRQLDDRWRAVLEEVVDAGRHEAGRVRHRRRGRDRAVLAALIDGFGVQVALSSSRRAVSLDQARRWPHTLLGVSAAQPRP